MRIFTCMLLALCSLQSGAALLAIEVRLTEGEEAVPARIHLSDWDGKPVKVTAYPNWHDHFVIPGDATVEVPEGYYRYTIEKGPEYTRVSGAVRVDATGGAVHVQLARIVDMPARGWWPGDLHVHRAPEQIEALMLAEDLHVAPVITWWNTRNYWKDRPLPEPSLRQFDSNRFYHLMGGEDERNGGAFLYFNLDRPLEITGYDKDYPVPFAGGMRREGDSESKAWVDLEKPFWWDVPAALAYGIGDSIGLANNHMCRSSMYESEAWGRPRDTVRLPAPRGNGYWSQEIYYSILNAGLRIPPSAGSASGVLPNPVGYNRVYVHLDGPIKWDAWWDGLKSGRSFVTNGPMLMVKANDAYPGEVFRDGKEISIAISAEIIAQETIPYIEVIKNGALHHSVPFDVWKKSGSLGTLHFDESGWFMVRCITDNPKTFRFASTAPFYVEIGRKKSRISRTAVQFLLDWTNERIARVKHDDPVKKGELVEIYAGAARIWEERLKRANAD
ncbi:MAG TPA: CehA/McbA family metallohydrolase [Candidatus Hydrogenedentes bacterium]|nr:CehA/McbA family metallohydrolase [Candidatus Hydrogenedentota bacterium]